MKNLKLMSVLFTFIFISACSLEDQGNQFSFGPKDDPKNKPGPVIKSECSFQGVEPVKTYKTFNNEALQTYDQLLKKYVTDNGYIKYSAWLTQTQDLDDLCSIVKSFENSDPKSMNREEQLTFYINVYNALTLDLILTNYHETFGRKGKFMPDRRSIRNIFSLDDDVWNQIKWKVGGQNLSLNQIEKDILTSLQDARIHFAINCASKGCPPLLDRAFTVAKLDEDLDFLSSEFVNSEDFTFFDDTDPNDLVVFTSSILDWYAKDFENDITGKYSDVQTFIGYYMDENKSGVKKDDFTKCESKDAAGKCLVYQWSIDFDAYDWSLNEAL